MARPDTTRYGKYTYIEYARFADDLVILIDAYQRHDWMMVALEKRLPEEFAELQVEINEEKGRGSMKKKDLPTVPRATWYACTVCSLQSPTKSTGERCRVLIGSQRKLYLAS
jgi:hypothetical protein